MRKKVLLIGHMRHGKDTVAEMLRDLYGFTFQSSSMAAANIFLYDALKRKYGYTSFEQCFEDRVNHRKEWHDLICNYNSLDKAKLAKEIMKSSDIYVGMRSNLECEACVKQGVFDLVVGVYDPRKPLEDKSSFDIDIWQRSHVVIPNSEGLAELRQRIISISSIFFK